MAATLDLALVACALVAAVSHLVWALALRKRPPPCERSGMRLANSANSAGGAASDVVIGSALARGLARAQRGARQQRRGSSEVDVPAQATER